MDCLQNIIGISRTECECLLELMPEGSDEAIDITTSESGVYMDELEGFNLPTAAGGDDCATGGIWEMMVKARELATLEYKNQMLACIGTQFKPRINNFTAQLGQHAFKGDVNPGTDYAGLRFMPVEIKGGFIIVKKFGVIVNTVGTVEAQIFSNENGGTLIWSWPIVIDTANTLTWATLTTPLELPMWSASTSDLKYYALLTLDGTFLPKANKENCGCNKKVEPYKQYLNITGIKGNDLDEINNFNSTEKLNGVVLDVSILCKMSEIICSDQYPPDYENDGNALNMAYAIRFKADSILYNRILSSDNINRFTLMDREERKKLADFWDAKFAEWVGYACRNSNNLYENDCLICRDTKTTITKKGIKVLKHGTHTKY